MKIKPTGRDKLIDKIINDILDIHSMDDREIEQTRKMLGELTNEELIFEAED